MISTTKMMSDYIYLVKNCSHLLFTYYYEFMNTINNVNNLYLSYYSILLFSNLRENNKNFDANDSKKKRVHFYFNWNVH